MKQWTGVILLFWLQGKIQSNS